MNSRRSKIRIRLQRLFRGSSQNTASTLPTAIMISRSRSWRDLPLGERMRKSRAIRGWMPLCKKRGSHFCRRRAYGSMTAYIFMADRITSDRDGASRSERHRKKSRRISIKASRSSCWSMSRDSCRNWLMPEWMHSFAVIPMTDRCFLEI